ncbi:hypothetical protein PM082_021483 [Marasmius tenuissimus]|nr:hypothetical protein PM082_021483 [Marasmius tenuissimus]
MISMVRIRVLELSSFRYACKVLPARRFRASWRKPWELESLGPLRNSASRQPFLFDLNPLDWVAKYGRDLLL